MKAMVERVDAVLRSVEEALPAAFPGRTWEPIANGMRLHAQRFHRLMETAGEGA
jgi:hypothetical protein